MDEDDQHGQVSHAMREAERIEAQSSHDADRPATPEEEAAIDEETLEPEVREHYEEMARRGAQQQGEGRIS